jgi:purine-binding chemotaxis protein CheW
VQTAASRRAESFNVLAVQVGGQRMALAASDVTEIMWPRATTRVPHAPPCLIGVLNLRGAVVPILSAATLLGCPMPQATAAQRVVILEHHTESGGALLGLLVDSVLGLGARGDQTMLDMHMLLAREFAGLGNTGLVGKAAPARAQAGARIGAPSQIAPACQDLALLGFALAGQDYAFKLADVIEVAALPGTITTVPGTDAAMLGAAAWRGGVLPLVSLRVLLGLPPAFDRATARLVVVRVAGSLIGLAVDGTCAISRVDAASLDPVPPVLTRGLGEAHIEAICRLDGAGRLASILTVSRLFDDASAARIAAQTSALEADGRPDEARNPAGPQAQFAEYERDAAEQCVVFQIDGAHYGVQIAAVDEVVRRPAALSRVPGAPVFLEGVMNLRGRALPVINQRLRLGVTAASPGEGGQARVLVVTLDHGPQARQAGDRLKAGFAVDSVTDVVWLTPRDWQPTPLLAAEGARSFDRVVTLAHDGRMILLIDPRVLLDDAERDMLAAARYGVPGLAAAGLAQKAAAAS